MSKVILTVAALGLTFSGMAQEKYVTSALTARNQKQLDEAKTDIDKAMEGPETKDKPKTLFAKGMIYVDLSQDDKYKSLQAYKGAGQALVKLVEIKPEYQKEDVNRLLYYIAQNYYNDGVNLFFNEKNTAGAIEALQQFNRIYELGGGKRFEGASFKSKFDTIAANSDLTLGKIAYTAGDSLEVIKTMTRVVKNKITNAKDNYFILLDAYSKLNSASGNKMAAEELEAIKEARTLYPTDDNIRNMEMNAYTRTGKSKELISKMEDAVKADPNNADLQFNLGLLYQSAFESKPANAEEMYTKAEACLKKAVQGGVENASYNYSLGALYFNRGVDYNKQMGETGTSATELTKAEALQKKRDAELEKAAPSLEKAASIYAAKEASLKSSDVDSYRNALICLKQIYLIQNKLDKSKEITAKINGLEGK